MIQGQENFPEDSFEPCSKKHWSPKPFRPESEVESGNLFHDPMDVSTVADPATDFLPEEEGENLFRDPVRCRGRRPVPQSHGRVHCSDSYDKLPRNLL